MSGLLARLARPGLFGAEIRDQGQALALHPDEERHVAGAGEKRRRDFLLGRACAHAALAGLGRDKGAIGKGETGAPLWPAGVVGSITHTHGYAAAMVAENFAGIGLDAERIGAVKENLWPRLFNDAERAALSDDAEAALLATLFFCAKEAAFKTGGAQVLEFRDIQVERLGDDFTATCAGEMLEGRFAVEGSLLLALVWR